MTRTALKRISLQSLLAAVGALLMLWVGIRQWQEVRNDAQLELSEADEPTIPQYDCPEQQTEGPVLGRQSDMFRDITEELGISFLHQPGPGHMVHAGIDRNRNRRSRLRSGRQD